MSDKLKGIIDILWTLTPEQIDRVEIALKRELYGEEPAQAAPKNLTLIPEEQHDKGVPTEAILQLFHECCVKLPKVKTFDSGRRAAVVARWREDKTRQTLAWWKRYFQFVHDKCPFLNGANDRQWRASFDFLMKKQNMRKVVENGYTQRSSRAS